ncbi:MAG: AmmeMemoRadiSam system radical SAM enzyme [Dehalococcoidales bacterium]|nr:AmmeMemoRadiSam system radical SAM enzyme [Dehalococcoidales bacterium]
MHEALCSETLPGSLVRCHICRWECKIAPGKTGVCRMYRNREGKLYNLNYALASSVAVDPIEKKPLNHFFPGSMVFSLGGWGCNFHCTGCQNWQIACTGSVPERESREISPALAVDTALAGGAKGIAWTYNEPGVWFEYTLDSARLAKQKQLYTVYVTNGYLTTQALDMIGPYLDAWRVDVKGFSDNYYRRLTKITHWRGILETAERAKHKWNMHLEVVTNIIPGLNDDDAQLKGIAGWIRDSLGELIPWHVTRFYPQYQALEYPATPLPTLEHALDIGRQAGLKFVYAGNVPGHDSENTRCYKCGRLVVQRQGYSTRVLGLNGSACKYCGAELNFHVS